MPNRLFSMLEGNFWGFALGIRTTWRVCGIRVRPIVVPETPMWRIGEERLGGMLSIFLTLHVQGLKH